MMIRVPGFALTGTSALVLVVLAGCASAPVPVVPDGTARVQVNDPMRVAQVQQQSASDFQALNERILNNTKIAALERSVEDLRNAVRVALLLPPVMPKALPAVPSVIPVAKIPSASSMLSVEPLKRSALSLEDVKGGFVYRLFYDTGYMKFRPPAELVTALREAALQAKVIDVRGYTDSVVSDGANQHVSAGRALSAKRWLVARGVDGKKITVGSRAANDFLIENATDTGKSHNRRVELTFRGITSTAVAGLTVSGD